MGSLLKGHCRLYMKTLAPDVPNKPGPTQGSLGTLSQAHRPSQSISVWVGSPCLGSSLDDYGAFGVDSYLLYRPLNYGPLLLRCC